MQKFLFVKNSGKYSKLVFADIKYVMAVDKYIRIFTVKKDYLILATLYEAEKILPPNLFVRVHRSYIVGVEHMTDFTNELVFVAGKELPLGKQYKSILHSSVIVLFNKEKLDPSLVIN